uniref:Uncharacterized protein n=1 Tax=Acrobeloides nanus TaxID=290746 RepID=A0A914CUL8_9BILA
MPSNNKEIRLDVNLERQHSITVVKFTRQTPYGSRRGRKYSVPNLLKMGFGLEGLTTFVLFCLVAIGWFFWSFDTISLLTFLFVLQLLLTVASLIHLTSYKNGCMYCLFATFLLMVAINQIGISTTYYELNNQDLICGAEYAETSILYKYDHMNLSERQFNSSMSFACAIINLVVLLMSACYWCLPDEIEETETTRWYPIRVDVIPQDANTNNP